MTVTPRHFLVSSAIVLAAIVVLPAVTAQTAKNPVRPLPAAILDRDLARSDYIENCGGCHGVQGGSAPAPLPELRDRVGYFMCTPASRAYLIRLPNVAHSRITDNQQLADLMNYVVFGLGGSSARAGTVPFTAAEVAYERQYALSGVSLKKERAIHVEDAIRKCHAPVSLRKPYPEPSAH